MRARAALLIFARAPRLGRVKTRLTPPLTARHALSFHVACLESTARLVASLRPGIEKWLYLTSVARSALENLRLPPSLHIAPQRGRNLGRRLERAFRERARAGADHVVIIGTDSPALTPRRLHQAFSALRRAPAVLGPARDGGFYLVGLRAHCLQPTGLFDRIEWGGPRTFRQAHARLRAAGLRIVLLPPSYDVDTSAQLARLARELRRSRSRHLAPLRAWLRQIDCL